MWKTEMHEMYLPFMLQIKQKLLSFFAYQLYKQLKGSRVTNFRVLRGL